MIEERCKRCGRTRSQLFDLDVELQMVGNPHNPEWICHDCLFEGKVYG